MQKHFRKLNLQNRAKPLSNLQKSVVQQQQKLQLQNKSTNQEINIFWIETKKMFLVFSKVVWFFIMGKNLLPFHLKLKRKKLSKKALGYYL